jgi:hypothetical protein
VNLIKFSIVFFLSLFMINSAHAAGSSINEDFSLVKSICDDMVEMAKKGNKESFLALADSALKLSEAMRRDNSMAIDRFRPKLRAAKKAGKAGDFDAAIEFVQEAKTLMKPATASWDGGS